MEHDDDLQFFGSEPFEQTVFQAKPPTALDELRARLDALEARQPIARTRTKKAPPTHPPADDEKTAAVVRAVHDRARALGLKVTP